MDDNNDWVTVSYNKMKKRLDIKNTKKNTLNSDKNTYLESLHNRQDFLFILLNKYNILDCKCKELLSKEIQKYSKYIKLIKKSNTEKDFMIQKNNIKLSIKNMNTILNKDNLYLLIGMGFISDKNNILLKDLPEFKQEVEKYNQYLVKKNESKSSKTVKLINTNHKIESNKSYASLFK